MNTENNVNDIEKEHNTSVVNCNATQQQLTKERLNLSLPKNLVNHLREDAESNYKSVTCVLIEIINFNKFMMEAIKKGYKPALEDSNGKIHYLMLGNNKNQLI